MADVQAASRQVATIEREEEFVIAAGAPVFSYVLFIVRRHMTMTFGGIGGM